MKAVSSIILLLALNTCCLFGQTGTVGINQMTYQWQQEVINEDSLTLYYDVTVNGNACRLISNAHWLQTDTLFVELLQESNNVPSLCHAKDTAVIGSIPRDYYTVISYLKVRDSLSGEYYIDTFRYYGLSPDPFLGINKFKRSPAGIVSSDDSLTFYYDITVGGDPCKLISAKHWVNADTLFVDILQQSGSFFALCDAKDTIAIGRLAPGCYNIVSYLSDRSDIDSSIDRKDTLLVRDFCVQKGLGIASNESRSSSLRFYPNPASESIHLQLPPTLQVGTVRIYSALGQLRFSSKISGDLFLSIHDWEKGLYFIRFEDAKASPLIVE